MPDHKNTLTVRFFTNPGVSRGSRKIEFPTRKAEALFYYLTVRKEASRDELAALLWPESDETTAKKNLRDALYKIKKCVGPHFLDTQHKQSVAINPAAAFTTDLGDNPENHDLISLSGDFLQGFLVRDAEPFSQWQRLQAGYYRNSHISRLYKALDSSMQKGNAAESARLAQEIMRLDEFDERACRRLMEIHAAQGAFGKAIESYNQLCALLDRELGVAPEPATGELYKKILEQRSMFGAAPANHPSPFFYGRQNELNAIAAMFHLFCRKQPFKHVIISGEAGIGKSRLKEQFLRQARREPILILESECFQAEEQYPLRSWNAILSQLALFISHNHIHIHHIWREITSLAFPGFSEHETSATQYPVEKLDSLKPKIIEDAVSGVLRTVARVRPLLLVFEDLHWMDSWGLSLLQSLTARHSGQDIFLLSSIRPSHRSDLLRFLALPSGSLPPITISLERFSQEQTLGFIQGAMPEMPLTPRLLPQIYRETEGIPFFIMEYLNMIREKGEIQTMSRPMEEILGSRLMDISEEGKKLLNILCLFFDDVSLDMLKQLSGRGELQILDILEELKNKFIIREFPSANDIAYRFTHQKLREFIHARLSLSRRIVLHNKAGLLLENKQRGDHRDTLLFPALIYHFTHAGQHVKAFKYSLRNAGGYLDVTHELFPAIKTGADSENDAPTGSEPGKRYIEDMEAQFQELNRLEPNSPLLPALEIQFLHMKGRFLIREGEYEKGAALMERVIHQSLNQGNFQYALKGYLQMIYYAIQTHNAGFMSQQLQPALELARKHGDRKDLATLLRLSGLNLIMSGQYNQAQETLMESLALFESLNHETYALCIAAIYNYLGEIRRFNRLFPAALELYKQAIEIGRNKNARDSLAVFYVHAGQAAFDNGDYSPAQEFFRQSLDLYQRYDALWGRSTATGYSALLAARSGDYPQTLLFLDAAENYAHKLRNPYELGLVFRVKAEIKAAFPLKPLLENTLASSLPLSLQHYCLNGMELLGQVKESYEADILRQLLSHPEKSVIS